MMTKLLIFAPVAALVLTVPTRVPDPQVTLCHQKGNGDFVTITVDDDGDFNGHQGHEGDVIPAPEGGCSTPAPTTSTTSTTSTSTTSTTTTRVLDDRDLTPPTTSTTTTTTPPPVITTPAVVRSAAVEVVPAVPVDVAPAFTG